MSESELRHEGSDTDEDKPRRNPVSRSWNRFAAASYSYVNNNSKYSKTRTKDDFQDDELDRHAGLGIWTAVLIASIIITIVALITTVIILSIMLGKTQNETCQSTECVITAGNMLESMDVLANPCQEFYQYACGTAITDPLVPPSAKKWGVFQQVGKRNMAIIKQLLDDSDSGFPDYNSTAMLKAKIYYRACMNTTSKQGLTTQPILQIIRDLGSWPLTSDAVSGTWSASTWNMEQTLGRIFWYRNSALFTMSISSDDKDSSRQRIIFDQGGTLFANNMYYTANNTDIYRDAYIKFFVGVVKLLGVDQQKAESAAKDVWNLEQALAKAFDKAEDRTDPQKYYNLLALEQVNTLLADQIDIQAYVKWALNSTISLQDEVIVYAINYLPKLATIMQAANAETLSTYMVWQVVASLVPDMPLAFTLMLEELQMTLTGVQGGGELWEHCVADTSGAMPFVTGSLFVQQYFSEADQRRVTGLLSEIRQTYVDNLPHIPWMDDKTRENAKKKADSISQKIGYPEFIKDPLLLDSYYDQLKVTDDNVLENDINLRRYSTEQLINKLWKPTDKSEWNMGPAEVNAYYSPPANEIVFPAGILQRPFYDKSFPSSLLFGRVGMVMGHELSHAFDNQGRLYDVHGNLNNWWTNDSAQAFIEKSACLVNQYDRFIVEGEHVNGQTTLGENIADNLGVQTTYSAFKARQSAEGSNLPLPGLNMTDDQLFFLAYAQMWCAYYTPKYAKSSLATDVHTYAKYRVIGTLQNMEEFATAYQCPLNSYMNPSDKCLMFT